MKISLIADNVYFTDFARAVAAEFEFLQHDCVVLDVVNQVCQDCNVVFVIGIHQYPMLRQRRGQWIIGIQTEQ